MRTRWKHLAGLLCVCGTLWMGAYGQTLIWLGTLTPTGGSSAASAVSNDGMMIVGEANGYATVWNRATNTVIQVYNGSSVLVGVSADGTRAVGLKNHVDYVYQRAFMWQSPNNFEWLPPAPDRFCWPADITPSGSHAVGKARASSGNNLPALWDLNARQVRTYAVPGDMYHGEAYGISDDARTVVAFGHGSGWGYKGVVFRLNSDGTVAAWAFLNPVLGHYGCVPRKVSGNGAIAVGNTGNFWGGGYYPVMWREANNWQPEQLAHLGGNAGEAFDIRGDMIVGFSALPNGQRRAVRWRVSSATTEVEDLNQTYAALLSDGSRLSRANGISANGRYIVGQGYNAATGRDEAFLLDTQGCASHNGDVDENGCVDDADLLAVLFAFGQSGADLGRVDVNCDQVVDDADLLQVLFNFGSGC